MGATPDTDTEPLTDIERRAVEGLRVEFERYEAEMLASTRAQHTAPKKARRPKKPPSAN